MWYNAQCQRYNSVFCTALHFMTELPHCTTDFCLHGVSTSYMLWSTHPRSCCMGCEICLSAACCKCPRVVSRFRVAAPTFRGSPAKRVGYRRPGMTPPCAWRRQWRGRMPRASPRGQSRKGGGNKRRRPSSTQSWRAS